MRLNNHHACSQQPLRGLAREDVQHTSLNIDLQNIYVIEFNVTDQRQN